jgi:hypothetical protein
MGGFLLRQEPALLVLGVGVGCQVSEDFGGGVDWEGPRPAVGATVNSIVGERGRVPAPSTRR